MLAIKCFNLRVFWVSDEDFKEGVKACCGAGAYGGIFSCGGTKKTREYELCEKAEEHIWWDSFHPTERIHEQLGKELWDGAPPSVGPYNLRDLFQGKQTITIGDMVDDTDRSHGPPGFGY